MRAEPDHRKLGATPTPRIDWREVYRVNLTLLKEKIDDLHDFYEGMVSEVLEMMDQEDE